MGFKKILVPLDGSVVAEGALAFAALVAGRNKAEMVLLTVCAQTSETVTRPRQTYLEHKADELRREGLTVSTAVGCGRPVEQIADYVAKNEIDLVAISSHGYSGFKRLLLGSVAGRVIDSVSLPILLVKAGGKKEETKLSRILLPLDGSHFSQTSIPFARAVAGKDAAELLLMTVAEEPVVPSDRSANLKPSWEEYRDALVSDIKAQATAYLERVMSGIKGKETAVRVLVEMGKPAKRIMKVARREKADLIALSSHGRTGAGRVLYGSVARKLINESPFPLLLIRPGIEAALPD